MIGWFLKKMFGTRNARTLKKMEPLVARVNELELGYQALTEDELKGMTGAFKKRLADGETLDDIMCEAFAVVKNACRRMVGQTITVTEHQLVWDMVPYDVQIVGGIVLHRGDIAEMATGEGKTLVATMPLYLNALSGRNCQLVTVNDYLARRDSEWMGAVFRYLGLTVGCIQHDQSPELRREQYECDITYGTNSEFGFDYLRDMGMARERERLVQRDHFFVIIDEVDNILIDEARIPLIISGPAAVSTHRYDQLKPAVADLYRRQSLLCARFIQDGKDLLEKGDDESVSAAFDLFCLVRLGMPKHKQLMRLMEDPEARKKIERRDMEIHSDSNRGLLQEFRKELYFTISERSGEADLTDKGRNQLRPGEPEAFVIPDLAEIFSQIDTDESLSDTEKAKRRATAQTQYEHQSETIHNISQLLRAYCVFEKDVQYVVQENKVMIVDEFTGRLMPGRRFSEGLHQALEAKEGVTIERETQTLASITIQNYFRLYEKLAGMTGTAETELTEFKEIYDLDVVIIPTNRPCIRIDSNDRIFKTKREKYNAIIEEIEENHHLGRPMLVGTVSVDVSELLSRMLQRKRIPHNVLNAKNHKSEAEIVARAGQRGAVTIATNMAGRGTDIKLGEGVKDLGGLHVIGSARHDSRRIDRQLRGRCSRQGDPGSSKFYVSLEDDLMRLFGSDRIATIMTKLGLEEGEELSHGMLNSSIERAQRRVEQQHFSVRKRTLEYDDVMNKQRTVIYGMRKDILLTDDPREMLFDFVYTAVMERVELAQREAERGKVFDTRLFLDWLMKTFPIDFTKLSLADDKKVDTEALADEVVTLIDEAYQIKEKTENPEAIRWLERQIMLLGIDELYREHLYAMDDLRQAVALRGYGQRDPLIEYKQESYRLFSDLLDNIKDQVLSHMFRSSTNPSAFQSAAPAPDQVREHHEDVEPFDDAEPSQGGRSAMRPPQKAVTMRRVQPKVGRNDPCPCGSGKKYKQCCGKLG
ncbi:MAG: preprotein translocase subunit SecA [Lentisphaeria bacterium]|nr:preprotein translocase subunit SecA [Lentisphaeria bacterium]